VKLSATARAFSDAMSFASATQAGANKQGVAHLATTGKLVSIGFTDKAVGTISTSVSATIHGPGETAVSLGRLAALVSSFAPNAIVEIEASARTMNVVCGSSRSRLPAVPLLELPSAIVLEQEIGRVEISSVNCLHLLEPIAVADVGRSRICLAGVFWHSVNNQLVAVSTDGVRLIRTGVAASRFSEDRTLIVPTEVAVAARRLLQKAPASRVTLRRSRSLVAFDAPSFGFTARLIDSSFPAYESIIPEVGSNSVVCNRRELLAAVSRLSAAAPSLDTALVAPGETAAAWTSTWHGVRSTVPM
jgi:DNA polymerase III sliding clamp (beta) subunit (PCNA family)